MGEYSSTQFNINKYDKIDKVTWLNGTSPAITDSNLNRIEDFLNDLFGTGRTEDGTLLEEFTSSFNNQTLYTEQELNLLRNRIPKWVWTTQEGEKTVTHSQDLTMKTVESTTGELPTPASGELLLISGREPNKVIVRVGDPVTGQAYTVGEYLNSLTVEEIKAIDSTIRVVSDVEFTGNVTMNTANKVLDIITLQTAAIEGDSETADGEKLLVIESDVVNFNHATDGKESLLTVDNIVVDDLSVGAIVTSGISSDNNIKLETPKDIELTAVDVILSGKLSVDTVESKTDGADVVFNNTIAVDKIHSVSATPKLTIGDDSHETEILGETTISNLVSKYITEDSDSIDIIVGDSKILVDNDDSDNIILQAKSNIKLLTDAEADVSINSKLIVPKIESTDKIVMSPGIKVDAILTNDNESIDISPINVPTINGVENSLTIGDDSTTTAINGIVVMDTIQSNSGTVSIQSNVELDAEKNLAVDSICVDTISTRAEEGIISNSNMSVPKLTANEIETQKIIGGATPINVDASLYLGTNVIHANDITLANMINAYGGSITNSISVGDVVYTDKLQSHTAGNDIIINSPLQVGTINSDVAFKDDAKLTVDNIVTKNIEADNLDISGVSTDNIDANTIATTTLSSDNISTDVLRVSAIKSTTLPLVSTGLEFEDIDETTCKVYGLGDCVGNDVIHIPESVDGKSVVGIGQSALAGSAASTIIIPSTIIHIEEGALSSITIHTLVIYSSELTLSEGWIASDESPLSVYCDNIESIQEHILPYRPNITVNSTEYYDYGSISILSDISCDDTEVTGISTLKADNLGGNGDTLIVTSDVDFSTKKITNVNEFSALSASIVKLASDLSGDSSYAITDLKELSVATADITELKSVKLIGDINCNSKNISNVSTLSVSTANIDKLGGNVDGNGQSITGLDTVASTSLTSNDVTVNTKLTANEAELGKITMTGDIDCDSNDIANVSSIAADSVTSNNATITTANITNLGATTLNGDIAGNSKAIRGLSSIGATTASFAELGAVKMLGDINCNSKNINSITNLAATSGTIITANITNAVIENLTATKLSNDINGNGKSITGLGTLVVSGTISANKISNSTNIETDTLTAKSVTIGENVLCYSSNDENFVTSNTVKVDTLGSYTDSSKIKLTSGIDGNRKSIDNLAVVASGRVAVTELSCTKLTSSINANSNNIESINTLSANTVEVTTIKLHLHDEDYTAEANVCIDGDDTFGGGTLTNYKGEQVGGEITAYPINPDDELVVKLCADGKKTGFDAYCFYENGIRLEDKYAMNGDSTQNWYHTTGSWNCEDANTWIFTSLAEGTSDNDSAAIDRSTLNIPLNMEAVFNNIKDRLEVWVGGIY